MYMLLFVTAELTAVGAVMAILAGAHVRLTIVLVAVVTVAYTAYGGLLGGWLGSVLFNAPLEDFFSIQTWLLAIGGSIIVLLIWGLVTRGSRKA